MFKCLFLFCNILYSRDYVDIFNKMCICFLMLNNLFFCAHITDDSKYFEPDPTNLPLGVCIENLVKVINAFNRVSIKV